MLRIIRTTQIESFQGKGAIERVEQTRPLFEILDLYSVKKSLAIGKGSPRYCYDLLLDGLKSARWTHDTIIQFLYRRDTGHEEMAEVTVKEFCKWAAEVEDLFDTGRQEIFGPRTETKDN